MHVLITGGTGTIGRKLVNHLIKHGHLVTVVSRQPYRPAHLPAKIYFEQWDGATAKGWGHRAEEVDAIVNLAGAGLADQRWTDERKKKIIDSRIRAGQAIVEAVRAAQNKPKVLIQSSGVGYYGTSLDMTMTESSPPGNDFLAEVCKAWEASTQGVEEMGVRRVITRSGVVFDPQGGALPKMVLPFRLFAGGPVGSGRQWLPWIHYYDEIEAVRFLIEDPAISGPVNLTSPYPVRNREFAKAVGRVLKRPAFAPAPGPILKLIFGEMSMVLLEGQQVLPARLEANRFKFKFPEIEGALRDLLT
jgi:uncharacterized protein (TIGR01777 family)